ncbi:MarR family winged helix-turn-helix transcriptional regulator [Streptomyces calidiresistens]|uniref:MarR family transcriptional regulator n=1 Tax=Streptomyces calidiresistens TaxID=1485586 RepID=A0A7W3T839_9ACTN|nr:MarR family transcriptional regulator [Streptomyces calidiresistens]MBB0232456.1 MarR family transcriptional regulator [Streptomyces calidiresistens]
MDATEPRWLTPEERETWLELVGLFIRLPTALDAQLRRDAGLSHFEYQVLAGLSEAPDRTLRMSDLAVFADGSLSRLSHVVKRLEQRGWVRRTPDPCNGRYTLAVLTDAGMEKVVATAPGHVEEVRRLVFDPLTPARRRQLRDIGTRINAAIGPDDCPAHLPRRPVPTAGNNGTPATTADPDGPAEPPEGTSP